MDREYENKRKCCEFAIIYMICYYALWYAVNPIWS